MASIETSLTYWPASMRSSAQSSTGSPMDKMEGIATCRLNVSIIGACLLLLSRLCGPASTQTTYGLIEGRITDATGGTLSGASITVSQPTTGFVRMVETNRLGLYRVLYLSPAEYDVTVELSGFAEVTRGSVRVDVGQAVALNVRMELGNVAAVIHVAPPIPTVNAVTPEIS